MLETNSEEEKLIYSYEQEIQKIKEEMSEQGRVSDDKMDTLRDQYSSLLEQVNYQLSPSNVKATFIQSTRMQRILKTVQTLSCWYSLESSG